MTNEEYLRDIAWLHVYPARAWHDPVIVLGNKKALRDFAHALLAAADGGEAVSEGFVRDGEGFPVLIARIDDLASREDVPVHYTDPIAADEQKIPDGIQHRLLTLLERKNT